MFYELNYSTNFFFGFGLNVLNSVSKSEFCLKQGKKISDFCLKQGQVWRAGRAAPPHPRIYRVPPPGIKWLPKGSRSEEAVKKKTNTQGESFLFLLLSKKKKWNLGRILSYRFKVQLPQSLGGLCQWRKVTRKTLETRIQTNKMADQTGLLSFFVRRPFLDFRFTCCIDV